MVVEKMEQTIFGCPSYWEGVLADGRTFDARYRYGHLSIDITYTSHSGERYENVHSETIGDEYDGILDEHVLKSIMKEKGFIFNDQ